jgi:hypothetical protein
VRTASRDSLAQQPAPVVGHSGFFSIEVAFGAALGVFGSRQRRQIDIQPQEVTLEGMLQGPTFAPEQVIDPQPQLRDCSWRKGIKHAGDGRLVSAALTPPGPTQGQIRPHPGIDLMERATAGQNAHEHIQQFVSRGMIDCFERQVQLSKHGRQKVGTHQTVAQNAQGGKRCIFRHWHQPNPGRHSTAPLVTSVQCIVPLPIQLERGWNRFGSPRILRKI